jgi:hypothetical protein
MVRYETRGGLATTCHHRQVRDSLEAGCGLLPPGVDAEGRLWRFDVRSLQPATPYELRLTDQSSLPRLDGLRWRYWLMILPVAWHPRAGMPYDPGAARSADQAAGLTSSGRSADGAGDLPPRWEQGERVGTFEEREPLLAVGRVVGGSFVNFPGKAVQGDPHVSGAAPQESARAHLLELLPAGLQHSFVATGVRPCPHGYRWRLSAASSGGALRRARSRPPVT